MIKELDYRQATSPEYLQMLAADFPWVIVGNTDDDLTAVYVAHEPNDATTLNLDKVQCQPINEYIQNIIL
ncbi:MAG: hypothetical protein Unbinned1529contig1001_41 [Prokaryotic dsDNA virus sp.]|nr:MAG: hypothetical protein Unbinned1529contig1001_41 [Prokaryotic dsDNA virus sp.]|tara:strand:+ start:836 stop:1045 length:210 start_codon:yes stop_codon:yes gene_type:complete